MTKTTQKTTHPDFDKMSDSDLISHFGNKSKSIRSLTKFGYSRSQIAKMLNIRYQHVRNVLVTKLTNSDQT